MIPVVITTINQETEAIKLIKDIEGSRLIIVGDKKTPNYSDPKIDFVSIEQQFDEYRAFSEKLPVNHYCRKNIGYIHSKRNYDFNFLAETDDDNIPYTGWVDKFFAPDFDKSISTQGDWLNIYRLYTDDFVWPRGLPLEQIRQEYEIVISEGGDYRIGVVQGLANGDPDVDSLYRLIIEKEIMFSSERYVIEKGTFSPFNSQNTLWKKEFLGLSYLPCNVTFRYTDILRGMIAQHLLWKYDHQLAFVGPTVFQQRNEHSLIKDFEDEVPMFLQQERVVQIIQNTKYSSNDISENLLTIYSVLEKEGIVGEGEAELVNAYLSELYA